MGRAHIAIGLFTVGGLVLGSQLYADPTPAPAPTPAPTSSDGVDATKLSPKDMQTRGDKMITSLNESLNHAQVAQARARKAKDILKLNCVNDGLLVTKQLVNVGEDARGKLDKAIQGNSHDDQVAQFNNLSAAVAQADQSKQSIDGCVGGSEVTIQGPNGSKVTVVHPIVRDNPSSDCNNLGLSGCVSEPLEYVAYVSPFSPN